MSKIPVLTAVRLIPRQQDYLNRKSGSNGEVFFDAETNTLRLYDGAITGGNSLITTSARDGSIDLPLIQKNKIRSHWDTLADLQSEVSPTTYHGMIAHVHSEGRLYFAHSGAWVAVANLSEAGGGGGGSQNVFQNFAVAGQTTVSADTTTDTLTFAAGAGITLTTDPATDTITLSAPAAGNSWYNISGDTGTAIPDQSTDTLSILGGTNITTAVNSSDDSVTINVSSFSIDFLSDVDTSTVTPASGQVLKWNGSKWAPGNDITSGGAGLDATTLGGFNSDYYLNYNNFTNLPSNLTLTALSVGPENSPSGNGAVSYDNATGVFNFTPPDLSSYITDYTVTQADVTQHQAALSITESQISDFGTYLTDLNAVSIDTLSDVDTTTSAPTNDQVLAWNGSNWVPADAAEGGGGEANQNAFSNIAVSGQTTVAADTATDTLTIVGGTGIQVTTDSGTDTITITNNASTGITAFSSASDATTASLTVDKFYLPAITKLNVTNNGVSAYRFDQYGTSDNPTIYALNGATIAFDLDIGGHPFLIQTGAGTNYDTGLYHVSNTGTVTTGSGAQGKTTGTLYWKIPSSISGGYRYQCSAHAPMVGSITIKDFGAI